MEVTEYHIHINALYLAAESRAKLEACGLRFRPFHLGVGGTHFTPRFHFSHKAYDEASAARVFATTKQILAQDGEFLGYIEAEYVEAKATIDRRVSNVLSRESRTLSLLLRPARVWREAELHVTVAVGSRLTSLLRDAGFYSSRITKDGAVYDVATAQGATPEIRSLFDDVVSYCEGAGDGLVVIKREMLVDVFVSPTFNWLPPQVESHIVED